MDIYLELWSIKEEANENFAKALEMTEKAGYQGVEFAGQYGGLKPEELKALLAKYHLKPVSAHLGMDRLRGDFEKELEQAAGIGFNLIVCPWLDCKDKGKIIEDAKFLESCAQKAAKKGIAIGYHNHSHEFTKFDGKYALDIILETAPAVKFQADVCWIANADVDPIAYIKPIEAAGRLCSIHAKEIGEKKKLDVYIGEGIVDFKGIAKIAPPDKYPYIVEQEDYYSDHLDGISKSYKGLRKVFDSL
jgi:sugar phosphate isomerase/epimerase